MKKKVGIFIESDFYEKEIFYYRERFPRAGIEPHFFSRLWGQPALTFKGHEERAEFVCKESFESMDDAGLKSFSAIIVPAGYVADRLRYTEKPGDVSPAADLLKRAFADRNILKGIICHGLWLVSPISEVIKDRTVTVHNNLVADARNYGARYVDKDIAVDADLVTARTGGHCEVFADKIVELLNQ